MSIETSTPLSCALDVEKLEGGGRKWKRKDGFLKIIKESVFGIIIMNDNNMQILVRVRLLS